jgi:hypothetical protein
VLFNANRPNIPFSGGYNPSMASPNDVGINMDTKPGSSLGMYNPSFLIPDDLPDYYNVAANRSSSNYENATVTFNTNTNANENTATPSQGLSQM